MVTILKSNKNPSTAERFAQAFQSAGQAIPEALGQYEKDKEKQELKLAKRKAKLRPALKTHLSLYDINQAFKSNPESMARLEEMSHKYLEQGFEPEEAVSAAYNDIMGASPKENQKENEEQGFFARWKNEVAKASKGSFTRGEIPLISSGGIGQDIKEVTPKLGRMGAQLAQFPLDIANKVNELKIRTVGKLLGRSQKHIDADVKMQSPDLLEQYDKLTNNSGVPVNESEQFASSLAMGPEGAFAYGAQKGLEKVGAPESIQHAGGILTFLIAHKVQNPKIKGIIKDAKKIAEKTGKSTESVLKTAQKESGVSLQKIGVGDAEEISKLKSKITQLDVNSPYSQRSVAKRVKETPKEFFNKKQALKEREIFGGKLPESPLEEYYGIKAREGEREASKKPETLQREKEIRDRLSPVEAKLFEEVRSQKNQLDRVEKELKGLRGKESEARVNTLYEYQKIKLNETIDRLKDVQYEMKYARPRPSELEIDSQINKSIKDFEEAVKNPSEETTKAFNRQLDLDQKYLDRASKLVKRGELPGEVRPDTFIKMKRKYLEGYKAAVQKSLEEIGSLTGERDATSLSRIKENKDLVDQLTKRIQRLEADIVNQTDNIKAMRALEKPSGAFYKSQIKSLKKDAALFKDDLFRQKKIKSREEIKTTKVFKEGEKGSEIGRKLAKNPSKENLASASKETGKTESELSKTLNEVKKEVKGIEEKVKSGTVTPNTEHKFVKRLKRVLVGSIAGTAAGMIAGTVEEVFGVKPSSTALRGLASILDVGTLGATRPGYNLARSFFDSLQADHLKKLKDNPAQWNAYLEKLRRNHGEAKVKRVRNKANEE